jgi:hypothetical protein
VFVVLGGGRETGARAAGLTGAGAGGEITLERGGGEARTVRAEGSAYEVEAGAGATGRYLLSQLANLTRNDWIVSSLWVARGGPQSLRKFQRNNVPLPKTRVWSGWSLFLYMGP